MTESTPETDARLPGVTLTAAGSGREVFLGSGQVPLVLVFHGQDTAEAAFQVNKAVRKIHPGADSVVIASVIDLRSFPGMFHGMVKPALERAYFKAAGKVPEGRDPADYVILLPDWDGAVHDAVGVQDSTQQAAVIVAEPGGRIVGRDQGENLGDAALLALDRLPGN